MISKDVIEDVGRYTFIDEVIKRGVIFYFYYTIDNKRKQKHLPMRSSVKQLQYLIDSIKKEIGGTEYGRTKVGKYYIIWKS